MNGAFGFLFKHKSFGKSFVYRIRMPDGKFANLFAFLKFPNLLRVGNCDISNDDLSTLGQFIARLKRIIGKDDIVAAKSFQSIGTDIRHSQLVPPKEVDLRYTKLLGENDGLTLKADDGGTRPFMNIHGALTIKHDSVKNIEM